MASKMLSKTIKLRCAGRKHMRNLFKQIDFKWRKMPFKLFLIIFMIILINLVFNILYKIDNNYKRWINKKDLKTIYKENIKRKNTIDRGQEVNTRKESIQGPVHKKRKIKKNIKEKVIVNIEIAYQSSV
jgi:hypothetical protein